MNVWSSGTFARCAVLTKQWRNAVFKRCISSSCLTRNNGNVLFTNKLNSFTYFPSRCYPSSEYPETFDPFKKKMPEFDPNISKRKFQTIYFFKPIKVAKVLSMLKIYQTGVTFALVPYSLFMFHSQLADFNVIAACVGLSISATVSLYYISMYIQNITGIIGVNEDMTKVMISHLNFWGKREDEIFKRKEIVPFSDSGEDVKSDIYKMITFFSNDQKFYLFVNRGEVVDREKFENIFGNLR
ncbi:unnamed protein product [Mytilus coruscus]|uniref:Transmembrane protein 186 n=1 Tax=Mytilus coruscus TaxID=42192 RepID=A0A6J8EST9_MYTCO|nr:unnamed protein product [Mytilus coruscus]